jgi:hypothetical protein
MLNKGSPANEIKKADLTKIKKLEEALAKLKSGEENKYVITKLSSIKSLCQNETIRQHYCWYLFDCVRRQLETKVTEANQQMPQEEFVFNLVHKIAQVMAEMQSSAGTKLFHGHAVFINGYFCLSPRIYGYGYIFIAKDE